MAENKFKIKTFPSSRLFTIDIGKLGLKKHHIKALIEIDVTAAKATVHKEKNEGRKISFTSFLIKSISKAVSENSQVHALRKGKRELVIFDEIDISIMVEKNVNGTLVPIPLVIRNTQNKTVEEIFSEIDEAKNKEIKNEKDYVIEKKKKKNFGIKLFTIMPGFLRLIIWKIMLSNPFNVKKMMGTVLVTSVGMISNLRGWFIPVSIHPLSFAIGSIVDKPAVVNGQIEIRSFLAVTILIDHDVVDGAPATRFVARLNEIIENMLD